MRTIRSRARALGLLLFSVAGLMLLGQDAGAGAQRVSWYADKRNPTSRDRPFTLADGARTLDLRHGWSCVIGKTSKKLPSYEERTTSCRKGTERFEFSVQCDYSRRRDHVQIRFGDAAGIIIDFIEVGCLLQAR
jgi:hypothetical protein